MSYHPIVRSLVVLLLGGCAKTIVGGCASDADCKPGVMCNLDRHRCGAPIGGECAGDAECELGTFCNLQTSRCEAVAGACAGAAPGDDDERCGTIECDGLDTACEDYADLSEGRCAGDGLCRPANDPATCGVPTDRCGPYTCAQSTGTPVCRDSCIDATTDCAAGMLCYLGRCCGDGWEVHTADSTDDVGQWATLAVDGDGSAHGAWFQATDGDLRVGRNTTDVWSDWTLSTIPNAGGFASGYYALSLAVDAAGTRHALYHVVPSLIYAYDDGSGWMTATVGSFYYDAALAAAPGGLAHVIAMGAADLDYRYYMPGGASGSCTRADFGAFPAITTDAEGRAHVAWLQGTLRYAAQSPFCDPDDPTTPGCCIFADVDSTVGSLPPGPPPRYSIAYDSSADRAHITYYDPAMMDLRHLTCDTSSCVDEAIATAGDVGRHSSVVVGAGGLHVAYDDATNQDLVFATNARGSWEHSIVDAGGSVGAWASLARGPDGRLHAAYYDADAQDAKYATLAPECVPGE